MNQVANAVSRKSELVALSPPEKVLLDLIKDGLMNDTVAQKHIKAAQQGKTKLYSVKDGSFSIRKIRDSMFRIISAYRKILFMNVTKPNGLTIQEHGAHGLY